MSAMDIFFYGACDFLILMALILGALKLLLIWACVSEQRERKRRKEK